MSTCPSYKNARLETVSTSPSDLCKGQLKLRLACFLVQGERVLRFDFSQSLLGKLFYLENVETGEDVFVFEETHHLELPEDSLAADEALKNVG